MSAAEQQDQRRTRTLAHATPETATVTPGRREFFKYHDLGVADASDGQTTLTAQLVARVPLEYSDFQLPRDETWWLGVRSGKLSPELETLEMKVIPGSDAGEGMVNGFTIELRRDDEMYRRKFSIRSMSNVAQREMVRLCSVRWGTDTTRGASILRGPRGSSD